MAYRTAQVYPDPFGAWMRGQQFTVDMASKAQKLWLDLQRYQMARQQAELNNALGKSRLELQWEKYYREGDWHDQARQDLQKYRETLANKLRQQSAPPGGAAPGGKIQDRLPTEQSPMAPPATPPIPRPRPERGVQYPPDVPVPNMDAQGGRQAPKVPKVPTPAPSVAQAPKAGGVILSGVSADLIPFLKRHEGLRLKAYRDSAGNLTIGYGSATTGGFRIHPGMRITEEQANHMLLAKLTEFEGVLRSKLGRGWDQLNPNQRAALLSMAYNLGPKTVLSGSVGRAIKEGRIAEVPLYMARYNKVRDARTGRLRFSRGVANRRMAEIALFNTPWQPPATQLAQAQQPRRRRPQRSTPKQPRMQVQPVRPATPGKSQPSAPGYAPLTPPSPAPSLATANQLPQPTDNLLALLKGMKEYV